MPERENAPAERAPPEPLAGSEQASEAAALLPGGAPVTLAGLLARRETDAQGVVTAMQRRVGNRATTAWLGRSTLTRQPAPAPAAAPAAPSGAYNTYQAEYDAARKERDAFVAAGKKGPQTYNPTASNSANYYGGFDMEYDPAKGELLVMLRGAVLFLAGMSLGADGRAQAVEPSAQTAAAAAAINRLPAAARAAEVAKWSWSSAGGPDATDETDLLDGFKSSIESGWRKKHPFYCKRQYWEDLGADTEMKVEVVKVAAAAGKTGTQHMLVNAHKVPKGFVGGAADVSRAGGGGAAAFDNVMNITSEDVVARTDQLLHRELSFQPGKGLLTPASVGTVWRLSKRMPNAKQGSTIPASGLRVKVQGKTEQQRKDRFDAVCDHLGQAAGFDTSRATFEDDGEGDSGHITIGTGAAQTVAAHEAGHMFGLDDEYTGAGDYRPGKKTEHTDFAAKEGMTGAMHATSDSIMSGGQEVRPHHYVTFLDALRQVSGIADWAYGPKQVVKAPSGAGDYPVPGTPGGGQQPGTAVA